MVSNDSFRTLASEQIEISQGYLSSDPDRTVRVRLWNESGYLTVKTRNIGAVRDEWEYEIPAADARAMLKACSSVLSKTRWIVTGSDGMRWEVDEFHGKLDGLIIAEIELPAEDTPFLLPGFAGKEVTGDAGYYNSNLAAQV